MKGENRMKKIHLKIYTGILAVCMIMAGLSSCTVDDFFGTDNVVEGEPVNITLNFAAVPSTDVRITRATGSDLSELSDIVICVFHGDGSFEQIVTNYEGGGLKVNGNTVGTNGENRYSVSFESTSGEKKLIAVANVAEGAFWENLITDLTAAYNEKKTFDQVKAIVAEMSQRLVNQAGTTEGMQPFHVTSSSQMLISGWNEGVVFGTGDAVTKYGTYGDETNNVAIKMKRAMAHITFNIAANPSGAKGTFTPTSFRVYNIPTKSHLTNGIPEGTNLLTTGVANSDEEYVNTAFENIGTAQGGNYSFNFYMPENVQEPGGSNTYKAREEWEGASGASAENKTWKNAPQNSTFVVISGTFEGDDTNPVTANVEYTIHLGNFGKSGDTSRDYGDFSVMRNYSYTYSVSVLDVNNIIVEAERTGGDYQNGAEGSVYDQSSTEYSYNLDAHYEQVYLEYNLSDIANSLGQSLSGQFLDDAIANQLILIIQSEAMDYTHEYSAEAPYTTRNKRGTLSPYKIYADAVRSGKDPADAKAAVLDGAGTGIIPTKGFDYKWIEFFPQTGTSISEYPGISSWAMEDLSGMENGNFYAGATGTNSMLDVYDMIVEMGKAIKQIYGRDTPSSSSIQITRNGNDYVARFTAFVNENYYLRHPLTGAEVDTWSVMTNKIPREMIIAMSTQTSEDGNSSYSKIHSYISQLAMQTFYNDRVSSLNAFGIETYNETPLRFVFGTPKSTDNLSDTNGRENQKTLIGYSQSGRINWSSYIDYQNNGWTASVGTNRSSHKLSTAAYSVQAAYSACMSRNRDLNGNGRIDEDEIRWFLPSLNEYIRMGIGANGISSAAQLYMGDKTTMTKGDYPSSYITDGSLYYTSSADSRRVYWAVEKGSYGAIDSYYDKGTPLPVRCIRNLPANGTGTDVSKINGVTSDATYKYYENNSPKLLVFKDRLIPSLYRQRVSGSLNVHNEDDDANSFYDGIFVAENFVRTGNAWQGYTYTYNFGNIIGYNGRMTNPCSTYSEGGYTNWRVPNLVELSAMNAAGLLTPKPNGYGDKDVACCTQFTNLKVRYGFGFSTLIYCPGAETNQINNQVLIRCVRDVPSGYTFPTN